LVGKYCMKEIPECYKIGDYSAPIDFVNKVKTTKVNPELSNDSLGFNTSAMYFKIPLEAEYLQTFISDLPTEFVSIRDEAHTQTIAMIDSVFPNHTMVRGGLLSLDKTAKQVKHQDPRVFHRFCSRVHWPIVTNPLAKLCIGDNEYHLPENTVWAFNNIGNLHYSKNDGTDIRFHIIIDVIPTDRLEFILKHVSGEDFYSIWEQWQNRKDTELIKTLGLENLLSDVRTEFIG